MTHTPASVRSYEALRLPERNRRERRAKYRALRLVARSRFAAKHGIPCDDIPVDDVRALLARATAAPYTARLRRVLFAFTRRHDREADIADTRAQCMALVAHGADPAYKGGRTARHVRRHAPF